MIEKRDVLEFATKKEFLAAGGTTSNECCDAHIVIVNGRIVKNRGGKTTQGK